MNSAYLDYNATAPLRPEAREAMLEAAAIGGNASSVHGSGRRARRAIEAARETLARSVGALPEEIVFTSGGTEANHLALNGVQVSARFVSAVEHESVLRAREDARLLPVDGAGRVDLAELARVLEDAPRPALVSVMFANNETGVLQPLADIVRLAHAAGALVHCDAVQALGKAALDFRALDLDLMSLSGHKAGGPQGVGALVVRADLALRPSLLGGGQELGRRAGTENLIGIAGFAAAARAACGDLAGQDALARMRDEVEERLRSACPGLVVWGGTAPRLGNTSCLGMPGVESETQVMALDLAGVEVSAGAACSSGKVKPSHVLRAMGVDERPAREAIRISLGWNTKAAELDRFVAAWTALYMRTVGRGAAKVAAA